MHYLKRIVAVLMLVCLSLGCGLKEGVVQKEAKSYLWFTGNTKGAIVAIDDLTPFSLSSSNSDQNSSREKHYEVIPGKHTIVITKDGREVVNRIIMLGDGMTKEIQIP
ncbi:MAG: hypothetical protein V6Z89_14025 [Desulfobacter sp.]